MTDYWEKRSNLTEQAFINLVIIMRETLPPAYENDLLEMCSHWQASIDQLPTPPAGEEK